MTERPLAAPSRTPVAFAGSGGRLIGALPLRPFVAKRRPRPKRAAR
ncbi:hypothetical protein BURPS668_3089 [Burkholderia pseudomallei 668]|nr:hypothetical protein BURPS668_3089 [Burkholderia pseudomallei 668]